MPDRRGFLAALACLPWARRVIQGYHPYPMMIAPLAPPAGISIKGLVDDGTITSCLQRVYPDSYFKPCLDDHPWVFDPDPPDTIPK